MLKRLWQYWRTKALLVNYSRRGPITSVYTRYLHFPEYEASGRANVHRLEPYEGLARFWDAFSRSIRPDYPSFLAGIARIKQIDLQSILDLACGTGTMTTQLASISSQVVGLDLSEEMLAEARSRTALPGITYVRGDFRDFQLGRTFDAVVCACNSLNYVRDTNDLHGVFQSVAKHLRPGGQFVFDTVTSSGMQLMSGLYLHVKLGDDRFAMRFAYDRRSRKELAEVMLPSGTEFHARIPIDPADVAAATKESGLDLEDYFSSAFWPGWLHKGAFSFFVLRRARN